MSKLLRERATTQLQRLNVALPKPLKILPTPPIDPALTTPGLSKLFTPNRDFYRIDGMVDHPIACVWMLAITSP